MAWNRHRLAAWVIAVACTSATRPVWSQSLNNGDFDQNLTSWQARGLVDVLTDELGQPYVLLREPGTGAASQISQAFTLPASPDFLTFRYRFLRQASLSKPVLMAAVSRRTHGSAATFDIDVMAGDTECRAAAGAIPQSSTTVRIVTTFDKAVGLLDRVGGDIVTTVGTISQVAVSYATVDFLVTGVPHAAEIELTFPGVVDDVFRREDGGSSARLCVAQVTGDYDNDGQLTDDDMALSAQIPSGTTATSVNFRADWDISGTINSTDRTAVTAAGLVNDPGVACPPPYAGGAAAPGVHPALPPDSFTAFLIKQGTLGRLGGLNLSEPDSSLTTAFYYEDAQGARIYDAGAVTVIEDPDLVGMLSVSLDLTGFSLESPARVVFALSSADNGVDSSVRLDSVTPVCPTVSPSWCCDPNTGLLTHLDDGDPCTYDECLNGAAVHTAHCPDQCLECNETSANIVIMLDRTGSTSTADLQEEKTTAKGLLGYFASAGVRPRIGVGSFHGPCQAPGCPTDTARMHPLPGGGYLTSDYGAPGAGLYQVIDDISEVYFQSALTDIASAISVGQSALDDFPIDEPRYLILISDGIATYPIDFCVNCVCSASRNSAETAADAAKTEDDIQIVTIHYVGHGAGQSCTSEQQAENAQWMYDNIASPGMYFEGSLPDGTSQLFCAFFEVMQFIPCNDDDPATADCCVDGQCRHDGDCPASRPQRPGPFYLDAPAAGTELAGDPPTGPP